MDFLIGLQNFSKNTFPIGMVDSVRNTVQDETAEHVDVRWQQERDSDSRNEQEDSEHSTA